MDSLVAMRGAPIRIHHHLHNKKVSRRRSTGSSEWKDWLKPRSGRNCDKDVSEEKPLTWYCDDREQVEESIWSTQSISSNTPSPDRVLVEYSAEEKSGDNEKALSYEKNTARVIIENLSAIEKEKWITTDITNSERIVMVNSVSPIKIIEKEIENSDCDLNEDERTSISPSLSSSSSCSPTSLVLRLEETGSNSSTSSSSSNFDDLSFDEVDSLSDLGPDKFGLFPDPGVIRFQFDDYPQTVLQSQDDLNPFGQSQQEEEQHFSSNLRSLHRQIGSLSVGNICLLEDSSYRESCLNFDSGFSESLSTGDMVNQNWDQTPSFRQIAGQEGQG